MYKIFSKIFIKNNDKNKGNLASGFTLVETLFAVFILTFVTVGLMTVVANSLFTARYARDEITANYLLQEVVDYMRNDRDATVFLGSGVDANWASFVAKYDKCATADGCYFDVLDLLKKVPTATIEKCNTKLSGEPTGCPFLRYEDVVAGVAKNTPFYIVDDGTPNTNLTMFQREVKVEKISDYELDVTATIYWTNGGTPVSRSLKTSLTRWQ